MKLAHLAQYAFGVTMGLAFAASAVFHATHPNRSPHVSPLPLFPQTEDHPYLHRNL